MGKIRGKHLFGSVLLAALLLPLPAAANTVVLFPEEHRYTIEAVCAQETQEPSQPSAPASEQPETAAPSQPSAPASEQPETPVSPASQQPVSEPATGLPILRPAPAVLEEAFAQAVPETVTLMRTAPVMMLTQETGDHAPYLSGTDGLFEPDRTVTREEFARLLSTVVAELPDQVTVLYDVPWSGGDTAAVQKAVGLGLMEAPGGFFRPGDPITRAECACALACLLPYEATQAETFPDVQPDHPAYDAISRAGAYGLLPVEEDGNFAPEEGLKRWELAAAFNRVLGRTPDRTFLSQMPAFETFTDVPADHPGYWDILEATVNHASTAGDGGAERWLWTDVKMTEEGPRRIGGRLYWIQDGAFVCDQYVGYLYFDSYGRYTTGSEELDTRLNNIIERLTDATMTRDQKLRSLFNYCRDYYTYLKRPLISKGQTGWEPDYALFFLRNGKGNCYCFSAAYCLLCRNLGLPAYTVVGRALNSPHGWVEIQLDGATYLFDTQLEWRYLHDWGMRGYNFFKQPYYSTTVVYSR